MITKKGLFTQKKNHDEQELKLPFHDWHELRRFHTSKPGVDCGNFFSQGVTESRSHLFCFSDYFYSIFSGIAQVYLRYISDIS